MSPQWLDMMRFAASEADRLGLEMCFHNCAGWSSSGGPWIKPAQAMQTVVSSETQTTGPAKFDAVLPQPQTNHGYYRDIAVVAFPTPTDKTTIDQLPPKSLSQQQYEYGMQPAVKKVPAGAIVAKDRVFVLTLKMAADGKLTWDVPEGKWTILRIGYTPTGAVNAPAPVAGRGLECDKLSPEGVEAHWAGGIIPILKHLGPLAGTAVNDVLIDSYEVGCNNWTPKFRDEFINRRGYDPVPFLPTLAGRYVGSGEMTERFLWDFRRTLCDLFAENYYWRFAELCHQHGLKFSVEPYDGPFECPQVGAKADIIMGEFWATTDLNNIGAVNTVKLAATVANTHGIPIVGAESFTGSPGPYSNWLGHPGMLKPEGDAMWCLGLNRFIFHTYVHQPWLDKLPGMTMGQWGTHFGRTNTWWELSKPWMQYIARSQYLLQQGHTVADVLFFSGEAAPNGGVFRPDLKAKGYDYDVVGTDLIMKLTVKDGKICTPAGGSYRLLVLPETEWMTPELAKKVAELVEAGATVLGPKPKHSPSLVNYPACDAEVQKIADEVWGKDGDKRRFGRGEVITTGQSTKEIRNVLDGDGTLEDFWAAIQGGDHPPKCEWSFIHRNVGGTDIYFVANPKRTQQTATCYFRVTGREPELWDAETGMIEPASMCYKSGDQTSVTLTLGPAQSLFVVFRHAAKAPREFQYVEVAVPADSASRKIPDLAIRNAVYGDLRHPKGGRVNVTAKLNGRIKDGELDVAASNDLAGDPAYNVVKQLRVDYVLDGAQRSITVAEGQALRLPPDEMRETLPAPRYSVEGGKEWLTAAEPGTYELLGILNDAQSLGRTVSVPTFPKPVEKSGSWDVTFQEGRSARRRRHSRN